MWLYSLLDSSFQEDEDADGEESETDIIDDTKTTEKDGDSKPRRRRVKKADWALETLDYFKLWHRSLFWKDVCMCLEGREGGWGFSNLRLLWTSCVRTEMCVMHLYVMVLSFYFIFYKFQIVKFLCFRKFFL